ncbi:hypothetical protein, partial [Alkalibacillus silvisoli]|uniref:hypothetical protein n=1 Tax=Alkalibacillus silvisoli TaxID=392823 RepID=UPI0031DB6806
GLETIHGKTFKDTAQRFGVSPTRKRNNFLPSLRLMILRGIQMANAFKPSSQIPSNESRLIS